jgi:hypothetical protein
MRAIAGTPMLSFSTSPAPRFYVAEAIFLDGRERKSLLGSCLKAEG